MTEKIPIPAASTSSNSPGCLPVIGVVISILFLLNLSAGFIELPDNLPIIGNLDEVFFSGLLFYCLAQLGVRLPGSRRKVDESADRPSV